MEDKQIYHAEVITTLYVLAGSDTEAEALAMQHAHGEDPDYAACAPVSTQLLVDPDWREALPYGGDGVRTVRQYLHPDDETTDA